MQITTEESVVIQKTKELCQTILDHPEYQGLRRQIEVFMDDDAAKAQYQSVSEKGEHLSHKQQQGAALSDEEINEFEAEREALFKNTVARDFLNAQQQLHKLQESVNQYVSKTFELGRVPETDDFEAGSCGSGCGCAH